MAFTFQELKTAKQNIIDSFGIDPAAAARVIGHYNKYPDKIAAMIAGDMSGVNLAALGITPTKGPAAAPAASDLAADLVKGAAADPDVKPASDLMEDDHKTPAATPQADIANDNRPVKAPTTPHNARKRTAGDNSIIDTLPPAQALPATSPAADPDIITDTCDYSDILPPGLYDAITALIDNYCRQQSITDRMKIHPLQWQGICYRVGEYIKQHKIIHDFYREKTHGGTVYDGNKLAALLILYGVICSDFKQVAFTFNFARFAGVSTDYLHDYMQRGLTSARVGLREKALELQKASLVGAVTGGGSATVGNIFLSKALAGLQESTTVVHVSAGPSVGLSDLPRLGENMPSLPG